MGSEVMEWKPTLQDTYGPNKNAFWWVVGEIYRTWETFNVKLWSNSTNWMESRTNEWTNEQTSEHTNGRKIENYIPLGINARGIIIAQVAVNGIIKHAPLLNFT